MTYLEPTDMAARALFSRDHKGPVVMVNLMRFRATADYAAAPDLAPDQPITGAEAYDRYVAHTLPHLHASGGEVLLDAPAGAWFIGPEFEVWDRVLIVRQASLAAFMSHATNPDTMVGIGHRMAALEDSRLLPTFPA